MLDWRIQAGEWNLTAPGGRAHRAPEISRTTQRVKVNAMRASEPRFAAVSALEPVFFVLAIACRETTGFRGRNHDF